MNRKNLLINDYIIHENLCNFRCAYCLGDDLDDSYRNNINSKESKAQKINFSSLENKVFNQLNTYEKFVKAEVLQLSGGEIFLIQDIVKLIKKKAPDYRYIYILTNGYPLDDQIIGELSDISNLVLGFSLDGHTISMNTYRFNNNSVLERILKNLKSVIKHSIPLIINSVLHDKNIKNFKEFLLYLSELSQTVCPLPIALRGKRAEQFKIAESDLDILLDIGTDEELSNRLINIIPYYFKALYEHLATQKKQIGCWIPNVATEMFHTGDVSPCPLFWIDNIGNIEKENPEAVFSKIMDHKIYKLLVRKPVRLEFCQKCFSSYDLINLFFESLIPLDELKKVPIFSDQYMLDKIQELKNKYVN